MCSRPCLTIALLSTLAPLFATAKPIVSAIKNVASYSSGPIAPGEMILIGGTGLGPAQLVSLQLDANGKVATTLGGVQVLF
ncbi:MAG: hypothetical protein ACRD4E_04035, partial [Bryobacteraceae bacterium]